MENETEKASTEDKVQISQEVDDDQYPTGPKLWAIFTAVGLVMFTVMLDSSIISTAIPRITDEFHSLLDVAWYGSAYQLASAAFQPFTGKLFTYLKTKWIYLAFFLLFELGSLLCAVATSSKMFVIARAVAGLGSSGLMNGGLTMISAFLPKHKRPGVIGTLMSIVQLGIACGPLVGGALTQYVTWRWCFYLNLPIGGLVLIILAFLDIPDDTKRLTGTTLIRTLVTSLDILGFILFAPAMIMFFLALQYGRNQYTWNSATVIGLFCGSGVMLLICLCWEYRRGDDAMIPFSIMRQRIVWSSCINIFLLTGASICGGYYLPLYFQAVMNNSPVMSGVYYLPIILPQFTMSTLSGILVQRLGYYIPFVLAGNILACIGYGLLSMLTPDYSIANRVGFQILVGFGLGTSLSMPMIALQNIIPRAQISVAMAVLVFCLNLGASVFLQLSLTVFSKGLMGSIPKYAPEVDPKVVFQAGATKFRNVITEAAIPGVLKAYTESINRVFYLIVGAAAMGFVFAWGMGWEDVRKNRPKPESSTSV